MNKAGFLVLGAVVSMGSFLLSTAGCGDSATGSGGSGGGAASTSTSVSTSTSTSGTSSSTTTSSSSSGGAVAATCATYCTTIMANCAAPNDQWKDMTSCLNACKTFPPGKIGDASGDSLECRAYHAGMPAKMNAAMHCPHAGPTGGTKDGAADGTCGNGCEAFCNLATVTCPAQEKDKTACMTECKAFKTDAADYTVADTAKNDFGCRMYHLSVASTDAASATTHCPHIVAASAVCIN